MKTPERLVFSTALGAIITSALFVGSVESKAASHLELADHLWWHGKILVDMAMVPGAVDNPTPGFAKLMSYPLGLLIYSSVSFLLLAILGRKPN